MFPIHLKLTVGTQAELERVAAFIAGSTAASLAAAPRLDTPLPPIASVSADEKAAVLEAPGKPSAAKTARSPRTAEAAPSQPAPSDAAPETTAPAVTPPTADAASAPAEFEYATLQKAVNAAVPKHGKAKLLAVAAQHGAENFKELAASAWAAAHADVVALG